jgi:hypothetical protein
MMALCHSNYHFFLTIIHNAILGSASILNTVSQLLPMFGWQAGTSNNNSIIFSLRTQLLCVESFFAR